MKITGYYLASIAITVMLIAGCAKWPITGRLSPADEDAEIARNMAEFAEAVRVAKAERAKADPAKAAPAAKERAGAEIPQPRPLSKEGRSGLAVGQADPRAQLGRAGAGPGLTPDQWDISEAIARWAAAWSRKDMDAYLAAYAENFSVPRGRSRRQWEAGRRTRIVGKSWIEVKVEGLEITVDGNVAKARFRQSYRADRYKEDSRKTLTLVRAGQQWLIQQERE